LVNGGWWGAILTISHKETNVMTIQALIDKVQEEKPNSFGTDRLLGFINEIEADVVHQIHDEPVTYTADDMETELKAPAPYDRLYVSYVKAMIDYANEEYASYQNNQMQHVQDFRDYLDWVVRTNQDLEEFTPVRFRNVF
jgi:hypothetical protein